MIRDVMSKFAYFSNLRLIDYAARMCGSGETGTFEVCVVMRLGEKEWDRSEGGMKRKREEEEGRMICNLKGVVVRVRWSSGTYEVVRWFKVGGGGEGGKVLLACHR